MLKLNPDKNIVAKLRKQIQDNNGYCPCSIIKDKDTLCPCKTLREDQYCCCGLYINDKIQTQFIICPECWKDLNGQVLCSCGWNYNKKEINNMNDQRIRGFEKISERQFLHDVSDILYENDSLDMIIEDEDGNFDDLSIDLDTSQIKLPQRATSKSSGYDFYSLFNFTLNPGEEIKLPTGIKAYMQDDEEVLLFPRSSVGFKYNIKLNNTIGKIDSDYHNNKTNEGHIWVKFTNTGKKPWVVNIGDAICQASFYNYLIADNDIPKNQERTGGIGSTGK